MNKTKPSRRAAICKIKSKVLPLMRDSGVSIGGHALMVYSTVDDRGNVTSHKLGGSEFFGICEQGLLTAVNKNGLVTVPWCAVTLADLEELGRMVEGF